MSDYWFAKKRIGWGVRPASFMGWLLTLVFVGIVVTLYLNYAAAGDMAGFFLWGGVSLAIFILITLLKLEPSDSSRDDSGEAGSSSDSDSTGGDGGD